MADIEGQPLLKDVPDNNAWERVSVSENQRMYLNGETTECNAHAKEVKAKNSDTSVDERWEVDKSLAWRDMYVMVTSALYLLPKAIVFVVPLCVVQIPFIGFIWVYEQMLPIPCNTPDRRGCVYKSFCILVFLVGLPMLILALISYLLDCVFYYLFSVPFCILTCSCRQYCEGLSAIKPYRNGPRPFFAWSDIITAIMGQIRRQGVFDSLLMLCNMWVLIPWLKYYINCNPWIYPLAERMIQQISTSMQDMSLEDITKTGLQIMSRTKQRESLANRLDTWKFVPHYPYPPPWKRWTVGIQAGGNKPPAVFFLLVNTTHALCAHGDSTEQYILSNSVASPGYRVMLWYNNPYHFFTGFVEASITHGRPQQTDKNRGGEHPMWLVTSRSPLLSDRKSKTGTGWIDNFFDEWLPTIVEEIRRLNLGHEIAKEWRDTVISKDGASRPVGKPPPPVPEGSARGAYFHVDDPKFKKCE